MKTILIAFVLAFAANASATGKAVYERVSGPEDLCLSPLIFEHARYNNISAFVHQVYINDVKYDYTYKMEPLFGHSDPKAPDYYVIASGAAKARHLCESTSSFDATFGLGIKLNKDESLMAMDAHENYVENCARGEAKKKKDIVLYKCEYKKAKDSRTFRKAISSN